MLQIVFNLDAKSLNPVQVSIMLNLLVRACSMLHFQARIQTACTLIERIGQKRGELVKHMQLLCEAYIELAYVNVTHLKNERGKSVTPSTSSS